MDMDMGGLNYQYGLTISEIDKSSASETDKASAYLAAFLIWHSTAIQYYVRRSELAEPTHEFAQLRKDFDRFSADTKKKIFAGG